MINSVDPTEGRNMINQIQSDPHDYEWINLFGRGDVMSLFQKMIHNRSPYVVNKINGIQREQMLG